MWPGPHLYLHISVSQLWAATLGNDKSNLKKWPNGTVVPWFPDIANIKDLFVNLSRKGINMWQKNINRHRSWSLNARNEIENLRIITDPFKLLIFLRHNNNYAIPLANFGDLTAKRPSIQTHSLTKDIAFSYAPEVSFGLRSGLRGRVQSVTNLGNLLCRRLLTRTCRSDKGSLLSEEDISRLITKERSKGGPCRNRELSIATTGLSNRITSCNSGRSFMSS